MVSHLHSRTTTSKPNYQAKVPGDSLIAMVVGKKRKQKTRKANETNGSRWVFGKEDIENTRLTHEIQKNSTTRVAWEGSKPGKYEQSSAVAES